MKFGHVSSEVLETIDFSLTPGKIQISLKNEEKSELKIFCGCGKWGIKEWVGTVYPDGTKEDTFLKEYINKFNAVELNSTFYRLSHSSIQDWASEAKGSGFRFCPKWSRRISHLSWLKEVEESTQFFIDACSLFNENLGATFLQLPENFGPKYIDRVAKFLETVPSGFPLHLELRHKDWFEPAIFEEVSNLLVEKEFGLVITDTAGRRDVVHMAITSPVVFIRFNGYGLHPTDYSRLDAWATRINSWNDIGVREVYFFGHQADEGHTPEICGYFLEHVQGK
jgi:uncharacterized protein YecE (DUF72 family)